MVYSKQFQPLASKHAQNINHSYLLLLNFLYALHSHRTRLSHCKRHNFVALDFNDFTLWYTVNPNSSPIYPIFDDNTAAEQAATTCLLVDLGADSTLLAVADMMIDSHKSTMLKRCVLTYCAMYY